jgi:hypothetical protein
MQGSWEAPNTVNAVTGFTNHLTMAALVEGSPRRVGPALRCGQRPQRRAPPSVPAVDRACPSACGPIRVNHVLGDGGFLLHEPLNVGAKTRWTPRPVLTLTGALTQSLLREASASWPLQLRARRIVCLS